MTGAAERDSAHDRPDEPEKRSLDQLALFGGVPAFTEPRHVGRPNIGDPARLMERIMDLLGSRWLTNHGPYVHEFEDRITEIAGTRHCIATCNGTVALEIAIRAAGLSGEVIVPSFTFVATAHALQWQAITPVFCDIDPQTHCIDAAQLEKLITPRTTGIIGVHVWGRPCDVEAIEEVGRRHALRVLFDAAHAFGCTHKGRSVGSFGDAEVFSFHATKFINTFEGGAIVTNDDDLAARARLAGNFGFADYDEVVCLGTNGKMSEVSAAMGLTSLESMDEFIAANFRNYQEYSRQLSQIPGVSVVRYDESERCNFQYIVLVIDESVASISRDLLHQALWAENVLARRYFFPGCHLMEPYRSHDADAGLRLPHTEIVATSVLSLPTGTAIDPAEISRICRIIRLVATHGPEVRERLLHRSIQATIPGIA